MTRAQLRADFHETTHGRYRNLFRLLTALTTRRAR